MPRYVRSQLWWSEEAQRYKFSIDGVPGEQERMLNWLESITSFSFRSRNGGHCTLRKQTVRRGSSYWYGYRRLHGRLVKRYVGKTTELSVARLEEVAHFFADELSFPGSLSPLSLSQSEAAEQCSSEDLLLFSKLSPPRLPALLVKREALFTRLDSGLFHTLTLLQAPAGSGKTTLVAQWIDERRLQMHFPRVVWLSLDAGDNDPLRFWRSLIRACQTVEMTVGLAALAHFSQSVQPPFRFPPLEAGVASFLHDLAHQFPDGLLILDDYHSITQPHIHESITFFLDHLPTRLRVLLLSRAEPPLPLLRWRAKGAIFSLHGTDLRFSLEETATFLYQAGLPPLSEATLLQLDAQLSGWATGLRLLAHTLQGRRTASEVAHALFSLLDTSRNEAVGTHLSQVHQQMLDYFVAEILQAQPEALQWFLLQTSLFSHLNASLCDAVIDKANGVAQLQAIERAGLFLEVVDGEALHLPHIAQAWYRYHALWASALRREAYARLGEDVLQACLLRASHWYEQHGMMKEAVETALQSQDLERAAQLIEQVDMQGQISEPHTLHRWLSPMPEKIFRAHPMLCWLYALSLHLLQDDSAITQRGCVKALLHMAEEGWRKRGTLAFLGLIDAFYALSDWRKGAFADATEHAKQALVYFADDEHHRRIRMFRGVCLFIVGTAQMYAGCFREARLSLLEASACCPIDDSGRQFTRSMPLLLGICSEALGELHQAHEYYQQAISHGCLPEDREILAQAKLGLARIAFEWNELTVVERQVSEARALAQEEDPGLLYQATFQLACLYYARGQFTSAGQQLAALQVRLQLTPTQKVAHLLPDVCLWQAHCHLQSGDLQNAQRLLEMQDSQEQMAVRIFQARLMLVQNQSNAARQQLVHLLAEAQEPRHTLEIQILLALVSATGSDQKLALHYLRQALSLRGGIAHTGIAPAYPYAARASVACLCSDHLAHLPVSRQSGHAHRFFKREFAR